MVQKCVQSLTFRLEVDESTSEPLVHAVLGSRYPAFRSCLVSTSSHRMAVSNSILLRKLSAIEYA